MTNMPNPKNNLMPLSKEVFAKDYLLDFINRDRHLKFKEDIFENLMPKEIEKDRAVRLFKDMIWRRKKAIRLGEGITKPKTSLGIRVGRTPFSGIQRNMTANIKTRNPIESYMSKSGTAYKQNKVESYSAQETSNIFKLPVHNKTFRITSLKKSPNKRIRISSRNNTQTVFMMLHDNDRQPIPSSFLSTEKQSNYQNMEFHKKTMTVIRRPATNCGNRPKLSQFNKNATMKNTALNKSQNKITKYIYLIYRKQMIRKYNKMMNNYTDI